MAVQLQDQGRLPAHEAPEISDDEGVGTAGEIGDVEAEELGMTPDEPGRLEDHLAQPPVHVVSHRLVVQGQEIHGDDPDAPGRQFSGNAHVGLVREPVVGPPEDHRGAFLGVFFQIRQRLPAQGFHPAEHIPLPADGLVRGVRGGPAIDAHAAGRFHQRLFGGLQPGRQVHDRRQELGPPFLEDVDLLPERGAQVIGFPLDDGADLGVVPAVHVRHRLEMGQEQVIGRLCPFVPLSLRPCQKAMEKPVGQLRRVAERGVPVIDPLGRRRVGQGRVESQFPEKGRVEGVVGVDQKAPVEADDAFGRRRIRRRFGRIGLEDQLLPAGHQVQGPGVVPDLASQVVIPVAGPAEGVGLPLDSDHRYFAAAVAFFLSALADKRFAVARLPVDQRVQAESGRRGEAGLDPLLDFEGHPEGPHEAGFGGHDDLFSGDGGHGQGHGVVVADPALHEDLFAHGPVPLDPVAVVHADGVDEAGHDVGLGHAVVDGGLDVRRNEGGALVVEVGGALPPQGDVGDFCHGDGEGFPGRFLQERAGAGGAGLVHGVVRGDAVGDVGVFGVLASDFEEGVDVGVEIDRRLGMGDDLVDDPVGHGVEPGDLPARSADAEARDLDAGGVHPFGDPVPDVSVAGPGGLHGLAVGPEVDGRQQRVVRPPQEDRLGGGGAHIQPQHACVAGPDLAPLQGLERHLVFEPAQGRQGVEGGGVLVEQPGLPRERDGLPGQSPQGRAQGLEIGRFLRDDEPRDLFGQVSHHHPVPHRAADHHDVFLLHGFEQLQNLGGHHPAEPGRDPSHGDPLVGGVGAVGLAEDRTPPRQPVGRRPPGQFGDAADVHIHPAELLEKELPGSRCAFVAGDHVGDLAVAVEGVGHEGFPAGGHDGRAVDAVGFHEAIGVFHRFGFGDLGKVDVLPEPAAGGGDPVHIVEIEP